MCMLWDRTEHMSGADDELSPVWDRTGHLCSAHDGLSPALGLDRALV